MRGTSRNRQTLTYPVILLINFGMCRKGPEQLCFLKLPSVTNPYALIMLVARAGRSNMGGSNPGDNFPDYKDVRQILLCFTGKVPCHSQIYF